MVWNNAKRIPEMLRRCLRFPGPEVDFPQHDQCFRKLRPGSQGLFKNRDRFRGVLIPELRLSEQHLRAGNIGISSGQTLQYLYSLRRVAFCQVNIRLQEKTVKAVGISA